MNNDRFLSLLRWIGTWIMVASIFGVLTTSGIVMAFKDIRAAIAIFGIEMFIIGFVLVAGPELFLYLMDGWRYDKREDKHG